MGTKKEMGSPLTLIPEINEIFDLIVLGVSQPDARTEDGATIHSVDSIADNHWSGRYEERQKQCPTKRPFCYHYF